MNDVPDRLALAPFPRLQEALDWLNTNVTQPWKAADAAALVHQKQHSHLAHTAIAAGIGAIILAVLQLVFKLSWPSLTAAAVWLEGTIVLTCVVAVGVGFLAKSDHRWLGCRHRAERLRMLKFKALARPELWSGRNADWQAWVQQQVDVIPATTDIATIEMWAKQDVAEADPAPAKAFSAPPDTRRALVVYYRHKRLLNQQHYFETKGKKAADSLPVKLREWRVWLFVLTIGCVLFHFAANWVAGFLEDHNRAATRTWELASLWGVALAAVLPVVGVGVRAWSAAFELSRKARSFEAKRQAMEKAAARLGDGRDELHIAVAHMQHDELFLEQEHREWLRLLLDAEWFI